VESEAIKGRPLALIFKFSGGITVLSVKHYAVYMQHKICLLLKLSRNEECMRKKTDMMFIAIINLFCTDYVQIKRTKARRGRRKNKKGENTLILKKKKSNFRLRQFISCTIQRTCLAVQFTCTSAS
jgi:hypothetical protein